MIEDRVPYVSVTIPVYNTSRYLHQCFDSLMAQTLEDIEFIVVDDGSTDDSGLICDEYAGKDDRFKVIHKENGGLASARQVGLDAAKGKYVIVCDSDDWVEPDMYEKLYQTAKETDADIVCCGYFAEYNDSRSIPKQTIFKETDNIVDIDVFLRYGANSSWVKLIKKSLFERANAYYTYGINLSEDSLIIYKLLKGNPKVVQVRENLYHYRRLFGGESYTNNVKMAHIYQFYHTYSWLKNNYTEDKFKAIRFFKAIDLAFACLRVNDLNKDFLRDFMETELPFCRFAQNTLTIKSAIVLVEKVLPLSLARAILKLSYKYIYK